MDEREEDNNDINKDSHSSATNTDEIDHVVWLNGKVNRMKYKQLQAKLKKHSLDPNGNLKVLKKRLKTFYKDRESRTENTECQNESKCPFKYLIIIDYEATCEVAHPHNYRQEIIEFPAVLIDAKKRIIIDEFHSYVRPIINPKLTSFCMGLTGISQQTVNKAPEFRKVFNEFEEWLSKHNLSSEDRNYCFTVVADGAWDMGRFLVQQCKISDIPMPQWGKNWLNIRKTYSNFYNTRRISLNEMLYNLGMKFRGRPHSGIDDSRNITRIALKLLEDGANMRVNEKLVMNTETNNLVVVSAFKRKRRSGVRHSNTTVDADSDGGGSDVLDAYEDYIRNLDPPLPTINDTQFPLLPTMKLASLAIK